MKSKKINKARVVWVIGLFALLIVILLMIMDYKINYQYSNSDYKLYFYKCNGKVCTTNTKSKNKKLYSEYECHSSCPEYKGTLNKDYAILKEEIGYILYNYKLGIKITEGYDNYIFINNKYIIVEKDKQQGVIDIDNNITISPEYTEIGYYKNNNLLGYNSNNIIAKKDDTYGILNYKTGDLVEEFKYKENNINKLLDIIKKSQ